MRITRSIAGVTLALSLTALVGCGSSGSTTSSETTAAAGSKTTATSTSGSSGTEATGAAVDVCKTITPEEVGKIVGGTVTVEEVPGGGCRFPQEDPRAPAASFDSVTPSAASGGYDGAKYGVTATIKGTEVPLDGVGDKAFIVVGTSPGGSQPQGGGLLQSGPTIVQVTLTQGNNLSAADVTTMTTDLMKLAAANT